MIPTALTIIGFLLALGGGFAIIVVAFRESFWWGIGCILLWPVQAIFTIIAWRMTWKPFLVQLAGWGLVLLGGALGPPPA